MKVYTVLKMTLDDQQWMCDNSNVIGVYKKESEAKKVLIKLAKKYGLEVRHQGTHAQEEQYRGSNGSHEIIIEEVELLN